MTVEDELNAMLEKAWRYLASAEALRRREDFDSAISRLYYAMFYAAEAMLLARGLSFSSHKAVIASFGQHFAKTGVLPTYLHQWLREAFEKRQISEYEFLTTAGDPEVADMEKKARRFVEAVEERLKSEGPN